MLEDRLLREEYPELPNDSGQRYRTQEVASKVASKVPTKSEKAILDLISNNPSMTRQELADQSQMSLGGIKKILASMKKNGWIEREGSDKTGYWVVLYHL